MLVVLGPAVELHPGVHGSLMADPPPGVGYLSPDHRHLFRLPRAAEAQPDAPFFTPSVMETVRYAAPPSVLQVAGVHSSRLPVTGGAPFLVDTDDLVLTLLYGRPLVRGGTPLPDRGEPDVRRRVRLMLAAYLSDRCHGVLFRTHHAMQSALALAGEIGGGPLEERLGDRSRVVRPSVAPGPRPLPTADRAGRPTHVLFAGDGWEDKGGPEAAEAMMALARQHGEAVRLTWVGPCPSEIQEQMPSVAVHPRLPRPRLLAMLTEVDVLLAPSRFESFGMVLVEALAHGAVPITSGGAGMEHVGELVRPGIDAFAIDTGATHTDRVRQLVRHVTALVQDADLLFGMQSAGWKSVASGELSLQRRDEALMAGYEAMARQGWPQPGPVAEDADPAEDARHSEQWLEVAPEELSEGYRRHRGRGRRVMVTQPG